MENGSDPRPHTVGGLEESNAHTGTATSNIEMYILMTPLGSESLTKWATEEQNW